MIVSDAILNEAIFLSKLVDRFSSAAAKCSEDDLSSVLDDPFSSEEDKKKALEISIERVKKSCMGCRAAFTAYVSDFTTYSALSANASYDSLLKAFDDALEGIVKLLSIRVLSVEDTNKVQRIRLYMHLRQQWVTRLNDEGIDAVEASIGIFSEEIEELENTEKAGEAEGEVVPLKCYNDICKKSGIPLLDPIEEVA